MITPSRVIVRLDLERGHGPRLTHEAGTHPGRHLSSQHCLSFPMRKGHHQEATKLRDKRRKARLAQNAQSSIQTSSVDDSTCRALDKFGGDDGILVVSPDQLNQSRFLLIRARGKSSVGLLSYRSLPVWGVLSWQPGSVDSTPPGVPTSRAQRGSLQC